jgi:DNA-binding transcriptional LysR family regulator
MQRCINLNVPNREMPMNHPLDDLELFHGVVSLISRPNHGYASWNGVSKRLRCNDDKIRRAVSRLEERFQAQLVSSEHGRLTPTAAGRRLHRLAEELCHFTSSAAAPALESVTVEIDEGLASRMLSEVFRDFLALWSGQVSLKLCPLNEAKVRGNVASGLTSFGVGFATEKSGNGGEVLPPTFGWCLIISEALVPAGGESPLDLASRRILFLPPPERQPEELEMFLRPVPLAQRVECPGTELVRSLVRASLGVGIVPDLPLVGMTAEKHGLCSLSLPELGEQQVCLYLPRDPGQMSDPARSLVEAIRQAIGSLAPPAQTAEERSRATG